MHTFRLGGPNAAQRVRDLVRDGTIAFTSPRGLAPQVAHLVEGLPKKPVKRILTGMDTEGAAALAARVVHPDAEIRWFHLDAYVARKVAGVFAANEVTGISAEALEDLPEGPFDLALLPFPSRGDALLMRDLLESVHDALRIGGRLTASTDRDGTALRKELEKVFGNVVPGAKRPLRGAQYYAVREREKPHATPRSHEVRTSVSMHGRTEPLELVLETRPGTFCHGTVDVGTRALLSWYEPGSATSVLDLGAGAGWLGIAAAKADPACRVTMTESNARAVGCAIRNLERNGVADRAQVLLRADLEDLPPPPGVPASGFPGYDLVLANPPYFGDFRIASSFTERARACLRPGGMAAFVVRRSAAAEGHAELLRTVFGNCTSFDAGAYAILTARRPARAS